MKRRIKMTDLVTQENFLMKLELKWPKLVQNLLIFMVALSVFLFSLRLTNYISLYTPLQVGTSGFEEESLYAVWKFVYDKPVYQNPHQIPFTGSYFNWFFYYFYGNLTKLFMHLFTLSDEWLPTVGRLISLFICLIGTIPCYLVFKHFFKPKDIWSKILIFSIGIFIFFGPLIGTLAISVRPDVLSLFFEIYAFLFLIKFIKNKTALNLIMFILFCYMAWATKQSYVIVISGACLYFLFERRFKLFSIISISMILLYLLTFYLGSKDYLYMILFSQSSHRLHLSIGIYNFGLFVAKTFPFIAITFGSLSFLVFKNRIRSIWTNHQFARPVIFCMIFGLPFTYLIANKFGAGDNYFFSISFLLTILSVILFSYICEKENITVLLKYFAAGGILTEIILIFLVLFGIRGSISPPPFEHSQYIAYKKCISCLPKPVYIRDRYASLPWINPGPFHFIRAATYGTDLREGIPFEEGGINGLIEKGYFASLVDMNYIGKQYRELNPAPKECKNMRVYIKKKYNYAVTEVK